MTKKELCKEIGRTICLTAVLVFCFVLLSGALHAEGLGSIEQPPQQIEPATGHYIVTDTSGNGVTVIRQYSTMIVTVNTYNAFGAPEWYQASGQYDWSTNTFSASLYRYTGGSCALCINTGITNAEEIGTLTIAWHLPDQAMMDLPHGQRMHLQLFNFGRPVLRPKTEYFWDSASN